MIRGIYSKRCWIENSFREATILINEERIEKIDRGSRLDLQDIIDAADCIVMPGVIDAHVHVNEPGRTAWEGFDSATQAAAAGGITSLIDMPLNASPVTTTVQALQQKLEATAGKLHVNCGFYGGIVPGNEKDIEELIGGGVFGIKAFLTHSGIDEFPNVGKKELEFAVPLLARYNLVLLVHCEFSDEDHGSALLHQPSSYRAYLNSRPKEWENKSIRFMIDLCRRYRCRVHIVHVSSAEALEMIQQAKAEGLPLSSETCPHYIYFSSEEIPDAKTIYKSAPPIREKENNDRLKAALKNGTLDFLASDHSPAPPELKQLDSGNLLTAWGGIAGLQFLLAASWTALKNEMGLEEFIPLLTEHPAAFLGLQQRKGFIREGYDADLVIWDPGESFIVKEKDIFHKHKISPYVSQQLYGKVIKTIVNGELVYDNGSIVNKNKGRWLLRK
jgi:allantoinase